MNITSNLPPILEEEGGTTDTLFKKKQLKKQEWNQFYDSMVIVDGTPIYSCLNNQPILLLIHGAGHCAMTFALLVQELKTFCSCVAYDMIQHGLSQRTEFLTEKNLIEELQNVITYIRSSQPDTSIILIGHSLGAALATKIKHSEFIRGLIIIDMIESKAIQSIPLMEQQLRARPSQFYSYSSAVSFHISNNIIKNSISASITVPHYLNEKLEWKIDLLSTKKYWRSWFEGMQDKFDNFPFPKMLFVAEADRLCSIQFRQTKYPIHLFDKSGHNMHEDEPKRMAKHISDFLFQQRIPLNTSEIELLNQVGIVHFRPKMMEYELKLKDVI